jgi:hypothetical protein
LQTLGPHDKDLAITRPAARACRRASENIGAPDERRDAAVDGMFVELEGHAHLFQVAAIEHRDAIAEVERFFLLVRHEHGRDADPLDDVAELASRPLAQRRIEIRQGLVEQQHARLGRQGARQGDALLLAARELVHLPPLETGEIDQRQRRRYLRLDGALLPALLRADRSRRFRLHRGAEQRVVLEHHPKTAACGGHGGQVVMRDRDPSRIRRFEPHQQSQHRRLAAARGSEQCEDLAAGDVERNRPDRNVRGPPFYNRADFEEAAQRLLPVLCRARAGPTSASTEPRSASRFQSTSATTMRRRTSRTQSGRESAGRSSRAGSR